MFLLFSPDFFLQFFLDFLDFCSCLSSFPSSRLFCSHKITSSLLFHIPLKIFGLYYFILFSPTLAKILLPFIFSRDFVQKPNNRKQVFLGVHWYVFMSVEPHWFSMAEWCACIGLALWDAMILNEQKIQRSGLYGIFGQEFQSIYCRVDLYGDWRCKSALL